MAVRCAKGSVGLPSSTATAAAAVPLSQRRVTVGQSGTIAAIDTKNGSDLWTYPTRGVARLWP